MKIGIVICDRYRRCAGGKCFRAMRNKEGAFSIYTDTEVELVGFTTCDGCTEDVMNSVFLKRPTGNTLRSPTVSTKLQRIASQAKPAGQQSYASLGVYLSGFQFGKKV